MKSRQSCHPVQFLPIFPLCPILANLSIDDNCHSCQSLHSRHLYFLELCQPSHLLEPNIHSAGKCATMRSLSQSREPLINCLIKVGAVKFWVSQCFDSVQCMKKLVVLRKALATGLHKQRHMPSPAAAMTSKSKISGDIFCRQIELNIRGLERKCVFEAVLPLPCKIGPPMAHDLR